MPRKKRKLTSKVAGDRISNLPNNVMCRVLSFLPRIYAVRTCVLSRQWKYKYNMCYGIRVDKSSDNLLLENVKRNERVFVSSGANVMSKSRKARVHEDVISSLSDDVVYHILSCLPTKDAVKTSVLSHQWRYKFASIHNIDIEVDGGIKCESCIISSSLCFFVNKLLTNYDSRIISFRLVSRNGKHCGHYLKKWIPQILNQKVQSLVLEFGKVDLIKYLPAGSAGFATLTTLNISLNGAIQFPAENCFLNLKSLYLSGYKDGPVQIQNELLIFPVLEVVEMRECTFKKGKLLEINAPMLITFQMHSHSTREDCEIKICGPMLTKLHYSCDGISRHRDNVSYDECLCGNRSKHPYYYVWSRPWARPRSLMHEQEILALRVCSILEGAPSIKRLTTSHAVAEALVKARVFNRVRNDPLFHQLERLEISCYPKELLKLLQIMPCLESLKVKIPYWHPYKQKESLPSFIAPCLMEIKFIDFYGGIGQMNLAKLFVENIKCLDRVIICLGERPHESETEITNLASISEKEIRDLLSALKPANSSCVIVFK